ncbi:putative enzyme [Vibrio chagasii]|nr:putative enzyme [Vibrio chagasii]
MLADQDEAYGESLIPVKCVAPSCNEIIRDGSGSRCPAHTTSQSRHKARQKRTNELRNAAHGLKHHKIYDTARWKRLSIKKRTIDPFCEDCWDNGTEKQADLVDHIVEISDDIEKAYLYTNLRSLCYGCHARKTADEQQRRKNDEKNKRLGLRPLQ